MRTSQSSGKTATVKILFLASCLGVLGCAARLWWGNRSTTLHLGMSQQQVQVLLGPPTQMTTQELNGVMVETWKYLDRTVTFANGLVQSWDAKP